MSCSVGDGTEWLSVVQRVAARGCCVLIVAVDNDGSTESRRSELLPLSTRIERFIG